MAVISNGQASMPQPQMKSVRADEDQYFANLFPSAYKQGLFPDSQGHQAMRYSVYPGSANFANMQRQYKALSNNTSLTPVQRAQQFYGIMNGYKNNGFDENEVLGNLGQQEYWDALGRYLSNKPKFVQKPIEPQPTMQRQGGSLNYASLFIK